MRACSNCKIEKSLDDFPKNKKCYLGHERKCKSCTYAARKHPEQLANLKKLQRNWYLVNREEILIDRAERYWSNPEQFRAYGRQHAKDHPEIYKAARHRRRSNMSGDLSAADVKLLFDNYDFCIYCNTKDKKLSLDHIIPISKGGENTLSNLVVACLDCNNLKRAKDVEEFI